MRVVDVPAAAVWNVLSDGWLYANWVVGASRIREVDHGWPQPGSRIHHSVGVWPAVINDTTSVLSVITERELVLRARAWPAGEAMVRINLDPQDRGRTAISMAEDVVGGPGRVVPQPVRQLLIVPRNRETLLRLSLLAEGRAIELPMPADRGRELG
jgi:uncharacterized protein YndB with AHSA1/START domain